MPAEIGRGLIVSCQAEDDSPFNMPHFIAAFAKAAEMGGALGVRVCGLDNLRAVRLAFRPFEIKTLRLTPAAPPVGRGFRACEQISAER